MRTLIFLSALSLGGCNKSPANVDSRPDEVGVARTADAGGEDPEVEYFPNNAGDLPALASTASESEMFGCETDSDCVVTCNRDGSCCDQLCQCTNVYAVGFAAKLTAQRESSCAEANCPIASCMPLTEQAVAVCNAGRCGVEMKAALPPRDRDFVPPE